MHLATKRGQAFFVLLVLCLSQLDINRHAFQVRQFTAPDGRTYPARDGNQHRLGSYPLLEVIMPQSAAGDQSCQSVLSFERSADTIGT